MKDWFSVDHNGLGRLYSGKGRISALAELIQNAWDEDATRVSVTLTPVPGRSLVEIIVEDDASKGFANLAHAFTLFAPSTKLADPERRGRFNIGEKCVITLCEEAEIASTTGTIRFDSTGRHRLRTSRTRGSRFWGRMKMSRTEYEEVLNLMRTFHPPADILTTINGVPLPNREPLRVLEGMLLPTEISDAEGILRRSTRKTSIRIYDVLPDERASVYEMGIPVVTTDDSWHYDIGQKVPLNMNRDNVPPGYLQLVRTLVLNAMHDAIDASHATAPWVRQAAADERCSDEATIAVIERRFGERRVAYDPSDAEGSKLAMSKGYAVVHGGALSPGEWANARRANALPPAGKVTPSPKVLSGWGSDSAISNDKYNPAMRRLDEYAKTIASRLLGAAIHVRFLDAPNWRAEHAKGSVRACYRTGELTLNIALVDLEDLSDINEVLLHEFAHHVETDHLSQLFHDTLCHLGAMLTDLALSEPRIFDAFVKPERSANRADSAFGDSHRP